MQGLYTSEELKFKIILMTDVIVITIIQIKRHR